MRWFRGPALPDGRAAGKPVGISKTPVREALLRLRHGGLVEIHSQRGTYVFPLDEAGLDHPASGDRHAERGQVQQN
jgi:DNA-binding FadR family transcriptional regulator